MSIASPLPRSLAIAYDTSVSESGSTSAEVARYDETSDADGGNDEDFGSSVEATECLPDYRSGTISTIATSAEILQAVAVDTKVRNRGLIGKTGMQSLR